MLLLLLLLLIRLSRWAAAFACGKWKCFILSKFLLLSIQFSSLLPVAELAARLCSELLVPTS